MPGDQGEEEAFSTTVFSVTALLFGGGGCNKDFINFGEWVGVLKVKLHYWLILRQGAENASFT